MGYLYPILSPNLWNSNQLERRIDLQIFGPKNRLQLAFCDAELWIIFWLEDWCKLQAFWLVEMWWCCVVSCCYGASKRTMVEHRALLLFLLFSFLLLFSSLIFFPFIFGLILTRGLGLAFSSFFNWSLGWTCTRMIWLIVQFLDKSISLDKNIITKQN